MRVWSPSQPRHPVVCAETPLKLTISQRGLSLLAIEFLTRFPAAECVVTSGALGFWDAVFDLFPKTLFQVFCATLEDPPRPNVIRHGALFDARAAPAWGARGAPYSLIFTGEGMESQAQLYLQAKPSSALLLVTEPQHDYLDGELVFPLYCSLDSGFCALVPAPGEGRRTSYAHYAAVMWDFQVNSRHPGSTYDGDMEDLILSAYARNSAGICKVTSLCVEMARAALPSKTDAEVVFWLPRVWPTAAGGDEATRPYPDIDRNQLEATRPCPDIDRNQLEPTKPCPDVERNQLEALLYDALQAVPDPLSQL